MALSTYCKDLKARHGLKQVKVDSVFGHLLPEQWLKQASPENLFGFFLPFTLQGENSLARLNNLGNVNFMLVLKGVFEGSLKVTLLKSGMRLFCLQLEASFLQWSLFTFN